MDMEIIAKFYTFRFYEKTFHSNYSKIPWFVEMKSKQQNNIYGLSKNIICGFLLPNTYSYFYFLQTMSIRILFFFPRSSLFGQSQVPSSWFKTSKNIKFKTTMLHE